MGLKRISKRFTPEAKTLIQKMPPSTKRVLRALTDEIINNPILGKELQKELEGFRSARYSHYRVIYEYQEKKGRVIIHYVGERKDVYSLFEDFLKMGAGVSR